MTIDPFLPAHALADRVRSGDITAQETTTLFLDRIRTFNGSINAFTDVTSERAMRQARAIDRSRAAGEPLGPLAGVPFAAKNLFDVAGLPTRAGSKINRERSPAVRDALLIERLSRAGAILVGALNMGEYAYDFTGENAHDGACRNPHDLSRMAGGSSSGSGAATAAGLSPISLGSDTNGSIRVPSSLCGIFGLKPTYGRLPRTGTFPFCESLDHLGPFARTSRDLALAYDAMQGFDPGDAACAPRPVEAVSAALDHGVETLRIAIAGGHFDASGMEAAADAVGVVSQALGANWTLAVDGAAEARAAAFLITNAESAAFHLGRLRARADDFDPETRDRFLAGALLPAAWLTQAQRVRHWFHGRMMEIFRDVDVLIAPATPCVAPSIGQTTMTLRGETVAVRPNLGLFSQPVSCIGFPVVTVPVMSGTMPIGVQLIAAPWREDLCLRAAYALERLGIAVARPPSGMAPAGA
ncbi:MAG: AtzE family amidohydrolase [Microvirga sp.]